MWSETIVANYLNNQTNNFPRPRYGGRSRRIKRKRVRSHKKKKKPRHHHALRGRGKSHMNTSSRISNSILGDELTHEKATGPETAKAMGVGRGATETDVVSGRRAFGRKTVDKSGRKLRAQVANNMGEGHKKRGNAKKIGKGMRRLGEPRGAWLGRGKL